MVRIRQHGSNNELFDVARLLIDIDRFVPPETWHVAVEWCVGGRAAEIEQLTESGCFMADADFRSIYSGVRQTIDGRFLGLRNEERLFELVAVDSSSGKWSDRNPSRHTCSLRTERGALWHPPRLPVASRRKRTLSPP